MQLKYQNVLAFVKFKEIINQPDLLWLKMGDFIIVD